MKEKGRNIFIHLKMIFKREKRLLYICRGPCNLLQKKRRLVIRKRNRSYERGVVQKTIQRTSVRHLVMVNGKIRNVIDVKAKATPKKPLPILLKNRSIYYIFII